MLAMGFGPEIRKIIKNFDMPSKAERQTLMFGALFPEEIQRQMGSYLHDYLFLSFRGVGGACTKVPQHILEVDRIEKREKLEEIFCNSGKWSKNKVISIFL